MRTGLPSEKKFLHLAMGLFLLGLIAFAPAQPWAQAPQPPPDPNTGANAAGAGAAQGAQAAGKAADFRCRGRRNGGGAAANRACCEGSKKDVR